MFRDDVPFCSVHVCVPCMCSATMFPSVPYMCVQFPVPCMCVPCMCSATFHRIPTYVPAQPDCLQIGEVQKQIHAMLSALIPAFQKRLDALVDSRAKPPPGAEKGVELLMAATAATAAAQAATAAAQAETKAAQAETKAAQAETKAALAALTKPVDATESTGRGQLSSETLTHLLEQMSGKFQGLVKGLSDDKMAALETQMEGMRKAADAAELSLNFAESVTAAANASLAKMVASSEAAIATKLDADVKFKEQLAEKVAENIALRRELAEAKVEAAEWKQRELKLSAQVGNLTTLLIIEYKNASFTPERAVVPRTLLTNWPDSATLLASLPTIP